MKNQVKKFTNHVNKVTTRLATNALVFKSNCHKKLSDESGESHLIAVLLVIILVIIVVVKVVMPGVFKITNSAMDGADSQMDAVWDFKG